MTTTKDQKTTLAKVEREAGKFVIFTSEFDLKGQKQYFKNNIFMLSLYLVQNWQAIFNTPTFYCA